MFVLLNIYFKLAEISMANGEMLATVCEEMPPFPERESSILAKLKKKKPAAAKVVESPDTEKKIVKSAPAAKMTQAPPPASVVSSADLLVDVFGSVEQPAPPQPTQPAAGGLVDGNSYFTNLRILKNLLLIT